MAAPTGYRAAGIRYATDLAGTAASIAIHVRGLVMLLEAGKLEAAEERFRDIDADITRIWNLRSALARAIQCACMEAKR